MSIEAMKLTDPHDHPEPRTMKWTQLEMDYINKRVEAAVRQAIEQAEQAQPVAWISSGAARMIHWTAKHPGFGDDWLPLYTAPPPRQPLTDEQWQVFADTLDCVITRSQKNVIESALGIKENT